MFAVALRPRPAPVSSASNYTLSHTATNQYDHGLLAALHQQRHYSNDAPNPCTDHKAQPPSYAYDRLAQRVMAQALPQKVSNGPPGMTPYTKFATLHPDLAGIVDRSGISESLLSQPAEGRNDGHVSTLRTRKLPTLIGYKNRHSEES